MSNPHGEPGGGGVSRRALGFSDRIEGMHAAPTRSPAVLVALVAALLLVPRSAAHGERLGGSVIGQVISVSGAASGDLAALGVVQGATAVLAYGVESTTAGAPGIPAGTGYSGAILDVRVVVGGWEFNAPDPPDDIINIVTSQDGVPLGAGLPLSDSYGLSVRGTDGDVLAPNPTSALAAGFFIDPTAKAMSDESVFQDASTFLFGELGITGDDGQVSISFGAIAEGNACLADQIGAGAGLCKAVVRCFAAQAKEPGADTSERDACIDAANARFISLFNDAVLEGDGCLAQQDGAATAASLAPAADALDTLVTTGANPADKNDAKARGAVLKAAAQAVGKALKAESKDAKKPNPAKRAKKREKARLRLTKKVDKVQRKAVKKGVVLGFQTQDVVDGAEAIVDDVVAASQGLPAD